MAYINIDTELIIHSMDGNEIQELLDSLFEEGYVPTQLQKFKNLVIDHQPGSYDAEISKLIGCEWRLTNDEVNTIMEITKRLPLES